MKKIATVLGAILAAIAASACCILPALLGAGAAGSLGLGAALGPYRPLLLALTFVLLGVAYYLTYRPTRKAACDAGECATDQARRIKRGNKAVLWIVTLFTLGVTVYPELAAQPASVSASSDAMMPAASAESRTVVFSIGKMTCESCTVEIADALRKTTGVSDAEVDFATKRASVHYARSQVSGSKLRAVIQRLGYEAKEE